jgi:hypothetical protein
MTFKTITRLNWQLRSREKDATTIGKTTLSMMTLGIIKCDMQHNGQSDTMKCNVKCDTQH